jgi:hypothetical protein
VGTKEFGDGGNHITIETHRVEFFSRFESKHKKNGGLGGGRGKGLSHLCEQETH